jgi:hypothetical protein
MDDDIMPFKEARYAPHVQIRTSSDPLQPATIVFAFADSPVAILAWFYEKMVRWSDSYQWTDEEVLTWVSLCCFSTAGPEASSYHYYAALHGTIVNVSVIRATSTFHLELRTSQLRSAIRQRAGGVRWDRRLLQEL